ncbi:MAG: hypothetical protein AB7D42_04735 [Candidatus Methanomethylophilaceae archaeon]|nr:hypothetical protein [Candidatus Methanomethylophilaceae archaeon]
MAMGLIDFFVFSLFIVIALFLAVFGTRARCVEMATCAEENVHAGLPGTTGRNDAGSLWKRRSSKLFALTVVFVLCAISVMLGFPLVGLTVAAVVLAAAEVFVRTRIPIR